MTLCFAPLTDLLKSIAQNRLTGVPPHQALGRRQSGALTGSGHGHRSAPPCATSSDATSETTLPQLHAAKVSGRLGNLQRGVENPPLKDAVRELLQSHDDERRPQGRTPPARRRAPTTNPTGRNDPWGLKIVAI